jgi:hypothetical protein
MTGIAYSAAHPARPLAGSVRRTRSAVRAARAAVRAMPAVQLALRGVLAGSGGAALLLAPGGRLVLPGLLAVLAVPALVSGVIHAGRGGPAVVIGAAVAAWMSRYGVTAAPLGTTLVLAATLYIHHLSAALCAALPPTATVDRQILARWLAHAATVLLLTGLLAAVVRMLGRSAASVPLELVALAAAVALGAVPVLLARRS